MAESRNDPSSIEQGSQLSGNCSKNNEIHEDLSLALNTFDDHIQAGLSELRSLVAKLRGERTGLTQRITKLGAELHQMTVERDHLQHTVSQQQTEISDIKDELNKQGDENGSLRREIKEMEDLYNNHLQKIAGRHRNRTLAQKSIAKWRRKMHSFPHSKKVQFSMLEAENENLRAELLACQEAAKQAFLHSANTLNTQALNMFQDAATRRLGLDLNDESEQGQQSSQLSSPTSSSASSNSSHQSSQSSTQDLRRSDSSTRTGNKENIPSNESENRIAEERRLGRNGSDNIRETRDDVRSEKYHRRIDDNSGRDASRYYTDEYKRTDDRTRRSATDNLVRPEANFQNSEQGNHSFRNKMSHGRGSYYMDDAGSSELGRGTFTFEMRGPRADNLDDINTNDYRLTKAANNSITSLHAEPLRQETLAHLRQLREEQQRRPAQTIPSVYEPQRKNPRTLISQSMSSKTCSCSQITKVSGPYRCPYCNPIHNIKDDLPANKTQQSGSRSRNTVLTERDKRKVIYKPSASTVVIEKHINK